MRPNLIHRKVEPIDLAPDPGDANEKDGVMKPEPMSSRATTPWAARHLRVPLGGPVRSRVETSTR